MNQRAGSEALFSEPLPDTPWPVEARNLLTDRERSLYQRLLRLYPEHKIFVQVALSQLIDVDRNHPERKAIRARYKQLVADFVLCRFDLSIVAVIELDDRSHERADRRGADARKNKALADAGIRLVRIPAGALPSEDALCALVDADGTAGAMSREETVLRLVETVETSEDRESPAGQRREVKESRVLRNLALKAALGGVLIGGWFIYSQSLQAIFKQATRPLAARHIASPSVVPQAVFAARPSGEAVAATRRPEPPDTKTLQKQKALAWAAAYSAPASCEHPADWNAQVECGNRYMRAKEKFEAQWAAEHGLGRAMQPVVLSNASLDSAHR